MNKPKTHQQLLADCFKLTQTTETPERSFAPAGLVRRVMSKPNMAKEVARDYAARRGIRATSAEIHKWITQPNFRDLVEEQICYYTDHDLKFLR